MSHKQEVAKGQRFRFGRNWRDFLSVLDDRRIAMAESSLKRMLRVNRLDGVRFLDAGSGSGLFSLAARNLGADVYSFDYDPDSVLCTGELRSRFRPEDAKWTVTEGSVLDDRFLETLGSFEVVYSWGVLHHTGRMWTAIDNVGQLVRENGLLYIAIYNYQPLFTTYWTWVKRMYNKSSVLRLGMIALHFPYLVCLRALVRSLTHRQAHERGMALWYDMIDWLGGYPFEAAAPEAIFGFLLERNFELIALKTCGGRLGCNEFVFRRRTTTGTDI